MKVFYVEDNFQNLINFLQSEIFGNIVSGKNRKALKTLQEDNYRNVDDISKIFIDNPFITIATSFQDTLKKMEIVNILDYDLFIFDRNLGWEENPYLLEDIQKIDPKFSANDFDYIRNNDNFGREGDYLLQKLCSKKLPLSEIKDKFYFFSAYPSDDVFNQNPLLHTLIEQGYISKENYLDKSNDKDKAKLTRLVTSNDKKRELYRKYRRALKYFECLDDLDNGNNSINTILSILCYPFDNNIEATRGSIKFIYKLYEDNFREKIDARRSSSEVSVKCSSQNDYATLITQWYKNNPGIPQNIVDLGGLIVRCRNGIEHYGEMMDLSVLTLFSQVFALLEIARYFYEKEQ